MRLFEKAWHFANAFFCFFFFFFAATFPEYRWIPSKKIIYRSSDSQCNSVLCCYERKFFWSILLLYKWQQRGIPQRLLDKCSHLFIWTLLKQTSSSRKNLLKWHDDIRTNSSCSNVLLWASFCFLEVSQQKHVGMVSTNNV